MGIKPFNLNSLMSPLEQFIVHAEIFEEEPQNKEVDKMEAKKELEAKDYPSEIPAEEQLEIIEKHWYPEAVDFKAAKLALRESMDGDTRSKALSQRDLSLERSNALLDAYLDISAALAVKDQVEVK